MAQIDWDSIDVPARKKSANSGGSIVFASAKNMPLTLAPDLSSGVETYEEVYDQTLRRSRRPDKGEDSKTKYAFKALVKSEDGKSLEPKVIISGIQIVKQLKTAISSAVAMSNGSKTPVVEVTANGTGRDTEYVLNTKSAIDNEKLSDYREALDEIDTKALISALLDGSPAEESSSEKDIKEALNFG